MAVQITTIACSTKSNKARDDDNDDDDDDDYVVMYFPRDEAVQSCGIGLSTRGRRRRDEESHFHVNVTPQLNTSSSRDRIFSRPPHSSVGTWRAGRYRRR